MLMSFFLKVIWLMLISVNSIYVPPSKLIRFIERKITQSLSHWAGDAIKATFYIKYPSKVELI
jgi:hypothetical protein